jgi:hypothetical protein
MRIAGESVELRRELPVELVVRGTTAPPPVPHESGRALSN